MTSISRTQSHPEPNDSEARGAHSDPAGAAAALFKDAVLDTPEAQAAYEDARDRLSLIEGARALRRRRKLSQTKVAELMGTTQSAVSDLEAGRVEPHLRTLQRYLRALSARLELIFVSDEPEDAAVEDQVRGELSKRAVGPILMKLTTEEKSSNRTVAAMASSTQWPQVIVRPILTNLQVEGWASSSRAGQHQIYTLNKSDIFIIGILLRRDKITAVLQDLDGAVRDSRTVQPIDSHRTTIAGIAADLVADLAPIPMPEQLLGVGVSIAGVVNSDTGLVTFAPDLEDKVVDDWRNVPIRQLLEKEISTRLPGQRLPVAVENDANALAVHEYLRRKGKCVASVVLSGAGIGVGAVMERNGIAEVHHGGHFRAGEGGHIIVAPNNGVKCRAGFPHEGCLETMASAQGILTALGYSDIETLEGIDAGLTDANDRIAQGDKSVHTAFVNAGVHFGQFLVAACAFLDPDLLTISAHKQFTHADMSLGRAFRSGVQKALKDSSLGELDRPDYRPRLEWHPVTETTHPTAAGDSAWSYLLTHPSRLSASIARTLV